MQRRSFMLSLAALPAGSLAVLQLPSLKAQILRRARELITDKESWITGKAFVLPPGGVWEMPPGYVGALSMQVETGTVGFVTWQEGSYA